MTDSKKQNTYSRVRIINLDGLFQAVGGNLELGWAGCIMPRQRY